MYSYLPIEQEYFQGDSGGPLVTKGNGKNYALIGIVSTGFNGSFILFYEEHFYTCIFLSVPLNMNFT